MLEELETWMEEMNIRFQIPEETCFITITVIFSYSWGRVRWRRANQGLYCMSDTQ
jgi:hypothetical protein